jgi:hypothetical protein
VRSATYRDLQIASPTEADRGSDIGSGRAPSDDRGTPVDGAVPDGASLVISRVIGDKNLAGDRCPEILDIGRDDLRHA